MIYQGTIAGKSVNNAKALALNMLQKEFNPSGIKVESIGNGMYNFVAKLSDNAKSSFKLHEIATVTLDSTMFAHDLKRYVKECE